MEKLNKDTASVETLIEFVEEMWRLEKAKKEMQELLAHTPPDLKGAKVEMIVRKYMPIIDKEIHRVLDYHNFEE